VIAVALFTIASIGCARSGSFAALILWRVFQGFAGGVLIPVVFSAVFLLFPPRLQTIATTIAGVLAVLAPTVGPFVGGWITDTFSWPCLFLINVVPGIVAALVTSIIFLSHCWRCRSPPSRSASRRHRSEAGRRRWLTGCWR
jgi:DHA2 family multidrug resistance protein